MKILPVSFLLILSFFFSLVGHSQNPTTEYYFKRISIEHGLSQSGVTTMVRDHKGLLWIGTRQGINRVDRNHLKKYMDDYIFQLLEDTQQNLWAITPKGVLRYNPDEDTFLPIINQQLFSICMTKKGVYFGGYAAIYQYDYTSKKIERLPLRKDTLAKDKECLITHLLPIDDDTVLVGTESDGLYLYSFKNELLKAFITENASPLSSLYYDANRKEVLFSVFQISLVELRC